MATDPYNLNIGMPIGGLGTGGSKPASPALKDYYLNYEPQAGFYSYLQDKGLLGYDPRARYAQQQYGSVYGQYQAAAADDPALGFYTFLQNKGVPPQAEWRHLSPGVDGWYDPRTNELLARGGKEVPQPKLTNDSGGFDFASDFAKLAPELRGDATSRFLTPRVRFLGVS